MPNFKFILVSALISFPVVVLAESLKNEDIGIGKLNTLHQVEIEQVKVDFLSNESMERDLHSGHSHNDKYSHNFYSGQDDYDDEVSKAVIKYDRNCGTKLRRQLDDTDFYIFDRFGKDCSDIRRKLHYANGRPHIHVPSSPNPPPPPSPTPPSPSPPSSEYPSYCYKYDHYDKPYRLWGETSARNSNELNRVIECCFDVDICDIARLVSIDNFTRQQERKCKRDCGNDYPSNEYYDCKNQECNCRKKCDKKFDDWKNYDDCVNGDISGYDECKYDIDFFSKDQEQDCKKDCRRDHPNDYYRCKKLECDCRRDCDNKHSNWDDYYKCEDKCEYNYEDFTKQDERDCKDDCRADAPDDYYECKKQECECRKKCDEKYDYDDYDRCVDGRLGGRDECKYNPRDFTRSDEERCKNDCRSDHPNDYYDCKKAECDCRKRCDQKYSGVDYDECVAGEIGGRGKCQFSRESESDYPPAARRRCENDCNTDFAGDNTERLRCLDQQCECREQCDLDFNGAEYDECVAGDIPGRRECKYRPPAPSPTPPSPSPPVVDYPIEDQEFCEQDCIADISDTDERNRCSEMNCECRRACDNDYDGGDYDECVAGEIPGREKCLYVPIR